MKISRERSLALCCRRKAGFGEGLEDVSGGNEKIWKAESKGAKIWVTSIGLECTTGFRCILAAEQGPQLILPLCQQI